MKALFFFLLVFPFRLLALEAGEALADSGAEARAVALGEQLRCMVCQGESINDSPAELARDMRALVRAKISEGWSDEKLLDYLYTRYGDTILMKPKVKAATLPLWVGPWIFVGFGGILLGFKLARKRKHKS